MLGTGCRGLSASPESLPPQRPRRLLLDAGPPAAGLDESFGFFCQALRPHNASFKEPGAPARASPRGPPARARSLAELPPLPAFPAGRGEPRGAGVTWGAAADGGSSDTPFKVRMLPDRREANGSPDNHEAGLLKVSMFSSISPAACRRDGGGCPLSHLGAFDSSTHLDNIPNPEQAVGVLTPLQGGISRPPEMRKLYVSS